MAVQAIWEENAQFAVVMNSPAYKKLTKVEIGRQPIVLVLRKDHSLAQAADATVDVETVANLPKLLVTGAGTPENTLVQALETEACPISPRVRLEGVRQLDEWLRRIEGGTAESECGLSLQGIAEFLPDSLTCLTIQSESRDILSVPLNLVWAQSKGTTNPLASGIEDTLLGRLLVPS